MKISNPSLLYENQHNALINANCVGFWPLDEGTGDVCHDFSGNSSTTSGSLVASTNRPLWESGSLGRPCIRFSSLTTQFVNIPDGAYLRPGSGGFSVSFWVSSSTGIANTNWITKRLNSGTFMQWNIGQGTVVGGTGTATSQVFFFMYDGSTLNGWHTAKDVIDGLWHHCVMVRPASGNPQIWIDNVNMTIVQENGNVISNLTNADPIHIGDSNAGGASTNAQIALVRYYMKALGADEINALYHEVQGPIPRGVPLTNRSFEVPSVGTWAYAPAGNGWNMGGSCGITVGSQTWISGAPQEGSQCAWIQGDGTAAQAFSQSISTVPGRTYYFSLYGSSRPTFGPQAFDLWLDGVAQGMWGAYYPQTAGVWNFFTGSFVAASSSHTFGFCGHNVLGGDRSCLLDNIRLWYYA